MNYVQIPTPRFILKELTIEDATPRYLSWFEADSVKKNIHSAGSFNNSIDSLKSYVEKNVNKRDVLFLGIFLKNELLHIGNIKFNSIDSINNYAILGIMVGDENWQGRGVVPEVIENSAVWLKKNRNINKIVLGVHKNNTRAINAYKKVGFIFEETKYLEIVDEADLPMILNIL